MRKVSKIAWIFLASFGLLGLLYSVFLLIPSHIHLIVKKTTIVFETTELDIGEINYKEPRKAEFIFKNTGGNELIIYDVQPSCGCTNVDWTREPIKSGQSGKISVVYDAETTGRFNKSIVVHCNCHIESIVLQISGEVIGRENERF
ncbi:MAG TPA: DUF1573 domain-containing protein [Bacteroidetes bacterium]|jgi:hypothetical protein|nr:DUF1573 domain-containing protein [Bacteroidota bacterium]